MWRIPQKPTLERPHTLLAVKFVYCYQKISKQIYSYLTLTKLSDNLG